jgi:hypothetical protein
MGPRTRKLQWMIWLKWRTLRWWLIGRLMSKRKASPSLCLHGAVLVLHISFKALKTLFDGYYLSFVFEDFLTFRLGL